MSRYVLGLAPDKPLFAVCLCCKWPLYEDNVMVGADELTRSSEQISART